MTWLGNVIVFQIGWFACVLGGAYQLPWLGTAMAATLIALHLHRVVRPLDELILILAAGLLGAVLDSLPVTLGLLEYPSGTLLQGTAPYWIVAMWMLFATTLNIALRWLKGRFVVAGLLGAVGGPLAYYGGSKLGGIAFTAPAIQGLAVLALTWSLAMPMLMVLAARFDGITVETDRKNGLHTGSAKAGTPS